MSDEKTDDELAAEWAAELEADTAAGGDDGLGDDFAAEWEASLANEEQAAKDSIATAVIGNGPTTERILNQDEIDSLLGFSLDDEDADDSKYWFTRNKIDKIIKVHDYLDSLDEVGKVLSFASMVRVAEDLNNGKKLQGLEMGVLYTKLPDDIKKEIIDPYISIPDNEARISIRIMDSLKDLRRNDLVNKIKYDLVNTLSLDKDEFKLAGIEI